MSGMRTDYPILDFFNSLCVPALRPASFSVDEIRMKGLAFINIQWRCIASLNVPLIDYYNIVAASSLADRDATAASSERAAKANTTPLR